MYYLCLNAEQFDGFDLPEEVGFICYIHVGH